jgi:ApaG protein
MYLDDMYTATTRDVTVSVQPNYLDTESSPDKSVYVWAYHVRITNNGQASVQLRARYWKITDAYGRVQEVRGAGVVGKEPVIKPGESFEYTSGTPLSTSNGIMSGLYSMQTEDGFTFDVDIPAFSLDHPHQARMLN